MNSRRACTAGPVARAAGASAKPNSPAPGAGAAGQPVAEDHRGQADEAPPAGLALAVDAGGLDGQERPGQPGQRRRRSSPRCTHPVDGHAQGVGRVGCLAARSAAAGRTWSATAATT